MSAPTAAGRRSMLDSRVTAAALLAVTVLACGTALLDAGGAVRLLAAVAFLLVVPGWAVVSLVLPGRPMTSTTVILSVAVSIALDVLVAQVMLLTGGWRPLPAFVGLAVASAVLLVVRLVRGVPR